MVKARFEPLTLKHSVRPHCPSKHTDLKDWLFQAHMWNVDPEKCWHWIQWPSMSSALWGSKSESEVEDGAAKTTMGINLLSAPNPMPIIVLSWRIALLPQWLLKRLCKSLERWKLFISMKPPPPTLPPPSHLPPRKYSVRSQVRLIRV